MLFIYNKKIYTLKTTNKHEIKQYKQTHTHNKADACTQSTNAHLQFWFLDLHKHLRKGAICVEVGGLTYEPADPVVSNAYLKHYFTFNVIVLVFLLL